MKAVFVHLSGSHRGDTQKFEKETVLIGCDPACDVRFNPGVDDTTSDRQAEVYFENCEYYMRDLGSARGTFVNGHEIDELILKDGDNLEFGEGGPKVRFHIERARGEVCKPFRMVYRDSLRKARRFRGAGVRTTVGFFGEFSRGLLRQSTPVVRMITVAALALVVFSILLSALVLVQGALSRRKLEKEIVQLRKQLTTDRHSREALEHDIAEERQRLAETRQGAQAEHRNQMALLEEQHKKLVDQLQQAQTDSSLKAEEMNSLRAKLSLTSNQIKQLEREQFMGERIIKRYQAGVCFIEGAFRYYDASDNPLRYLAIDSAGEPIKDSSGHTFYTTSGSAPIVQVNYSGTGFLVSSSGLILTNRHVADPGWEEEEATQLQQKGLNPRFEYFRAYFPSVSAPFSLKVVKLSDQADVALLKTDLGRHKLPVMEIETNSQDIASGQSVMLLGYPTGLDALLARLDERVVDSVVSATGPEPAKISQELSRRGMIRPLATQGHLSDILPNKLVYDAQTTHGGSGGPLFNVRGKVIAVNFAILSDFSGANFGVPIRFGVELIK